MICSAAQTRPTRYLAPPTDISSFFLFPFFFFWLCAVDRSISSTLLTRQSLSLRSHHSLERETEPRMDGRKCVCVPLSLVPCALMPSFSLSRPNLALPTPSPLSALCCSSFAFASSTTTIHTVILVVVIAKLVSTPSHPRLSTCAGVASCPRPCCSPSVIGYSPGIASWFGPVPHHLHNPPPISGVAQSQTNRKRNCHLAGFQSVRTSILR